MENKNLAKRIRELMWKKLSDENQLTSEINDAEEKESKSNRSQVLSSEVHTESHDFGFRDIDRLMQEEDEARKVLEAGMNGIVSGKRK